MKQIVCTTLVLLALVAAPVCGQSAESVSDVLKRVAEFHGNAGVFAVAGYRIGQRALQDLGEKRGSFDLDVTHRTPLQVQYSCVADGLQAATGVSAGKLNLHVVEANLTQFETIVKDRKTGKQLVFRLRPAFLKRYLDTPNDRQHAAASDVATMPENEIFSVQSAPAPKN